MSNISTHVNSSQPGSRRSSLTARYGVGYKPADRPFERGEIALLDWRIYKQAVRWCRWSDHTTKSNAEFAAAVGCHVDTVSIVWRRLAEHGLIRRERDANLYRTYVLAFVEPEPEPEPEPSPVDAGAALVWAALLLLQRAAAVCSPSSVEPVVEPVVERRGEPTGDASGGSGETNPDPFFVPSASDPKVGSARSDRRSLPNTYNSSPSGESYSPGRSGSSLRSNLDLPPGLDGGGVGKISPRRDGDRRIPETETVARLRAFGVSSRSVLRRNAERPLADVERLILAVEHWVEPVEHPAGLLATLLDEGLWSSRAAQIEAALAAAMARRKSRCASCGRGDPLLWQYDACPRCGSSVALVGVADPSVVAADPEPCASCGAAPVPVAGDVCRGCQLSGPGGLDRDSALLLIARWGAGVGSAAPVPTWLSEAAR